jgi:hypothetical protein
MGEAKSFDETNYEGFIDNTATFSSGTSHTGAMCRHYVGTYNIANAAYGERKFIVVTLMVYRANSQGGLDARSITVNISLDSARQEGGIQYE